MKVPSLLFHKFENGDTIIFFELCLISIPGENGISVQNKIMSENIIFCNRESNEVLQYLQSLSDTEIISEIQSLPENNLNDFWDSFFDSTDIDHLRNVLDLFIRCAPQIALPCIIQKFPFDTLIELEGSDEARKNWIVNAYLHLCKKYYLASDHKSLKLPHQSKFHQTITQHVRSLPPSDQLLYIHYTSPDVIESTRSVSEKIARGVVFPSQAILPCENASFEVRCLVLGIAGVGKSTLINVAHKEYIFEEATGGATHTTEYCAASRTYERQRHANEDSHSIPESVPVQITFTDSPGPTHLCQFHSSNQEQKAVDSFQSFLNWIHSDVNNRPHMILYCINSSSNRISDYQYFWIISLARFFPVILVMTSSFSTKNRKSWETEHFSRDSFNKIGIVGHIFVNSREVKEADYVIPSFGLNQLATLICTTFNKNISNFIEEQQLQLNQLSENDATRTKLSIYCHGVLSAGVISSITAGCIPVVWVNDAATIAVISAMLSAMTTAYGLSGIIGTKELWEVMKKSLVRVGIIQASAIGGLILVDQFANIIMTIPWIGPFVGSGISGTCSGVAAFFCGKIWWAALEKYRLEFKPGTDDPQKFLVESIEKASQDAWNDKYELISEMNAMIRKQKNVSDADRKSEICQSQNFPHLEKF